MIVHLNRELYRASSSRFCLHSSDRRINTTEDSRFDRNYDASVSESVFLEIETAKCRKEGRAAPSPVSGVERRENTWPGGPVRFTKTRPVAGGKFGAHVVAGSTERIGAISPARESGAYCVGAVGERATTSPQLEPRRVWSRVVPRRCASPMRLALPHPYRDSPRLAAATT